MKLRIIIILLFFISINGFSQVIKFADKSDLQPVSNVSISDVSGKTKITTDAKGNADLSAFGDNDILVISHISFQEIKKAKKDLLLSSKIVYLSDNVVRLGEVTLSANKTEELKQDVPNRIVVIPAKQIAFINPQTTGDLLQQTGNVFVQQSQMGGSSPVLRGFEANRVLIVVDGVRMNNAVYRSGHLQNVITIDPTCLEKTEVLFGPGSVVYGSDAIGGVMHFITASPEFSKDGKALIKGNVLTRYASANNENTASVNLSAGFKKWGSFTSISYKNLGDLRSGNIHNPAYGDWGKRFFYTERINGVDSMVENSNPNVQMGTAYSQYDIMEKIVVQPCPHSKITANLQYSNSSDIPRYDRLTQMNGALFNYAEWYYGPQTRLFGSLSIEAKREKGFFNNGKLTLAYQDISEDRIQRKFNKTAQEHREETIHVLSANLDFFKNIKEKHELRYGLETNMNDVGSVAYAKHVDTGEKSFNISSRYPDNGSKMSTVAAYLTHNWEMSKKIIFSQGLRFSDVNMNCHYSDTMMSIMKFPFEKDFSIHNSAFNGSAGLVLLPGFDWKISLMASSGFRVPNVDDITKVNDSKGKNQLLVVPNINLKPENAYNFDFSINKVINKTIELEGTVFYTMLKDAIQCRPFLFNGEDSVMYDGYMCQVLANINAGDADVYGFQTSLNAQVTPVFSIFSNLTYTYGRMKTDDAPMDHIPPLFGMTSFKMELKKFKSEFYIRYNGWKNMQDYNLTGEDNVDQATIYGCPGWYTLNIRTAYQVNKFFSVQLGLENILDDHYRYFASGVSAPGRNLVATVRASF